MQKEVKTKHFCVHLPKPLEATRAAVAVQLSTCIQKTSTVMMLTKSDHQAQAYELRLPANGFLQC